MKVAILVSLLAGVLMPGPCWGKAAKKNDQCEVRFIQAYMDEECKQQYRSQEALSNQYRIVDAANKIALYADGSCAPMSRLLPPEVRDPASLVANAASLTELFGRVECNENGMSFKLFYDPGCGNPVVPPQDFLLGYQLQGWNLFPWNFEVNWDTCYALNAQNNIFIKVQNAVGLRSAVAAIALVASGYLL